MVFPSATKSSQISPWVKAKKNQQKMRSSTQLKKDIGFYFKTCISCKHGSKVFMAYKACLKPYLQTVIRTSECSWAQNLPLCQTWKSFQSLSCKSPLKLPTKPLSSWKPTWEEPTLISIKNSSTDAIRNPTNSRLASLLSVISTHW